MRVVVHVVDICGTSDSLPTCFIAGNVTIDDAAPERVTAESFAADPSRAALALLDLALRRRGEDVWQHRIESISRDDEAFEYAVTRRAS